MKPFSFLHQKPQVITPLSVEYIMIGGGGGGANTGSGGGAGGKLNGSTTLSSASYDIVIGSGGSGGVGERTSGSQGSNTTFNGLTALGGGYGITHGTATTGINGGCGGGAAIRNTNPTYTGGTGSQGGNGGNGFYDAGWIGGSAGGGGASGNGGNGSKSNGGGAGGSGYTWVNGVTYAGGGGGGMIYTNSLTTYGVGGTGGGGNGGITGDTATNGTVNLGGGGGGGAFIPSPLYKNGGNGGSGVVVIRYSGTTKATGGTISSAGGYTYHTFNSSGTLNLITDPDLLRGFVTEWTVSGDAAGRTITLPTLTGYTYNYDVDWGDGSAVQNITTFSGGTHTYASDGVYQVEITKECPCWSQFNDAGTGYRTKLTNIISWGNPGKFNGFKFLYGAFRFCTNLKSFGKGKILDNGLTNANALFAGCSGIYGKLPSDLLHNCTGITFDSTFLNCSNVRGPIPVDLFRYGTSATNFASCFQGCNKLTEIPADLFRYNTSVAASAFISTFNGCTGLTEIPADLFRYNTGVTTSGFRATFASTSITSIPTDLFRYNTLVSTNGFRQTFYNCSQLESVPQGLFKYNTAVTTDGFNGTFNLCNKLVLNKYIFYSEGEQSTRFLNKSVGFTNCFARSSYTGSSQGTAPDLWACSYGTGTPVTTTCYGGEGNSTTSLSNYNDIPAGWK